MENFGISQDQPLVVAAHAVNVLSAVPVYRGVSDEQLAKLVRGTVKGSTNKTTGAPVLPFERMEQGIRVVNRAMCIAMLLGTKQV